MWEAFWDLDSCRPIGMGLGPIPWTAMLAHKEHYGYDKDVFDYLWDLIRAMDAAYLSHVNKKSS